MFAAGFTTVLITKPETKKLREVCVNSFSETYEHLNTPENFRKYVETNFSIHRLEEELENENSFTYLLYYRGEIAGYLKLNTGDAQTENISGRCLEIERIYVLKKFQGRKAGQLLLKKSIAKGRALKKEFIWLGVWEKNKKAIEFYEKNNFIKFDTHIFTLGEDNQVDFLYKYIL
ncbi:MAG: GNAT family N-acetyltransferase [Bacteroidetes bacterium]|nr:GNAT family N-acetyltransferase [Bacteroidota bacterium]